MARKSRTTTASESNQDAAESRWLLLNYEPVALFSLRSTHSMSKGGKPALVLDLVEEFRAPVVDRAILAIANQGIALETDAHGLIASSRKLVAERVLERLATPVPYEGKRWPLGIIIQNQARHLAVAVRGEREYRAFAIRQELMPAANSMVARCLDCEYLRFCGDVL